MEMVNPIIKKDMREKTKKPVVSRPDMQDKAREARKKHDKIDEVI